MIRLQTQTEKPEKGTSMSIFKDLADSKEKRKARAFYDQVVTLSKTSKDSRKLRALIGNRSKAFFDKTFVEGAKKTEAHQKAKEAGNKTVVLPASQKHSSPYKQVKTVGGTVWVYLPENITGEIFELGCKYQSGLVSKEQAIEVAESIADKISDTLDLDNKLIPLAFLSEQESLEDESTL